MRSSLAGRVAPIRAELLKAQSGRERLSESHLLWIKSHQSCESTTDTN
jgi:hypothetical protein